MTDVPNRFELAVMLFPVVAEWLRNGVEEAAQYLIDDDPQTADRDGVTRHISSVMIDDTGRIVVKSFGGDLFFFRVDLQEL